MKIVIPGGSGHVGQAVKAWLEPRGWEVTVLSRSDASGWDGKTLGSWAGELEGADAVLNLAGRSVNCRYHARNLAEMMDSRIDSTRVVGQAIAQCTRPPKVWLQSSTATIYAHRLDAPNDEFTGRLGFSDDDPRKWKASFAIAQAWEDGLARAETPRTRRVALRTAMVMSAIPGSVFDVMSGLAKKGLYGPMAGGRQYVSWIHDEDFCRSLEFILEREHLEGAVNISSPNPLPQAEFAQGLRDAVGAPFGLPTAAWMLEIGTRAMQTETELVLKSRRVTPGRLLAAGFEFLHPHWPEAAADLAAKLRPADSLR